MSALLSILIEKAGYDNGFENTDCQLDFSVLLSSARHPSLLRVKHDDDGFFVELLQVPEGLEKELQREFATQLQHDCFRCENEALLHAFLRRVAALSRALPNQAVNNYQSAVAEELEQLPPNLQGTEVERVIRQRIGQEKYRNAMLDYWGNACAVSSITISGFLRASHAIPWAECKSDADRLDVFNGFLLGAHLDALFDRFLIGFDQQGDILFSPRLDLQQLMPLGITPDLQLRWVDERHLPYLEWHRNRVLL